MIFLPFSLEIHIFQNHHCKPVIAMSIVKSAVVDKYLINFFCMNFYIFSPSFLARARSFSRIAVTSSSILTIKRSFCMKIIKKCSKIPEIFNSHQWYHQVFSATTKWHILECTTWSWEQWTNRSNEPTTEIRSPSTWWVSIAQCWRWKRPKNHQKYFIKSQKKSKNSQSK